MQPRVLLRTEVVTRTVFVTTHQGTAAAITNVAPPSKPSSLTEQEFFAGLAGVDKSYPDRVRDLLDRCRVMGCEPRLLRRYNIYVDDNIGGAINVGSVSRDGTVEVWGVAGRDAQYGRPIGRDYLESVARLLPGGSIKDDLDNPAMWHVRVNDRVGIPVALLLDRMEGWIAAISNFQAALERVRPVVVGERGTSNDEEAARPNRFTWTQDDVDQMLKTGAERETAGQYRSE